MGPVVYLLLSALAYLSVKGRLPVYIQLATVPGAKQGGAQSANETTKTDKPVTGKIEADNPKSLLDNWFGQMKGAASASFFSQDTGLGGLTKGGVFAGLDNVLNLMEPK